MESINKVLDQNLLTYEEEKDDSDNSATPKLHQTTTPFIQRRTGKHSSQSKVDDDTLASRNNISPLDRTSKKETNDAYDEDFSDKRLPAPSPIIGHRQVPAA